ncbi:phosphatidylinositol 4-5-bisphosphate 3-kinase catalytic subunit alpha isoform [Brachionus plicatilis]|uniref:Phosphatidylinositol 4-5-bisphosphate 3-kinase catalytic subunit alpha isoform n=1 Tax=Brachionus plicatilis TaxID=10195 RepID=A0A3M7P908_BRAPC|nr:phosphatidylinositol 4-5-bisphosphate 3-kinase catalytic subunit alpha isoform [Brachionus plicatilis]
MPMISTNSCPNSINLDILLPNGLLLNLQLKISLTLEEIRQQVWQEASKISKIDPCLSLRNSIKDYIFTSVTREAVVQEFYDYTKRLCDLKLFQYFFQLVETSGNIEEKLYNSELSKAVGLYVTELDKISNEELVEFRQELFKEVLLGHQENKSMIQNFYSPNLEINPSMLDFSLGTRINMIQLEEFDQATVDMCILVTETDRHETKYHLNVPLNYSPSDLISLMIVKKMEKSEHSDELIQGIVEKYKDSYVLQICGCDEIIFGSEHKIGSYKVTEFFFFFFY